MTNVQIIMPQHQVDDVECPHSEGPFHFWECDGPFTVTCTNCDADGVIVQTGEPEYEENDE